MDSATPFQPWTAKEGALNERDLVDDAKLRENVNHPKHSQTASYDKETGVAASNVPGPSTVLGPSSDPGKGKDTKMDSSKIASMQQIVESTLSPDACQRISQLLDTVEALSGPERLLLYLKLPTGVPPHDPLKQPVNPLGSRAELQQTITWIQTHLEVDPDVSLPKQEVYDEYIAHCMNSNMKPLSTADFGKVMKQVYPTVRPRRLGTRGHSRYCYAGLRKKIKLEVPQLPNLGESIKDTSTSDSEKIVCEWAETKLGVKFDSVLDLSRHLVSHRGSTGRPPTEVTPPMPPLVPTHVPGEEPTNRHLIKQLKRKLQTHSTPGRPKKYKAPELTETPSTSFAQQPVKLEGEGSDIGYGYEEYARLTPFTYAAPPPAHPPPPPHEYRAYDAYPLEPPLSLPMNLSSDASLDLTRRRPPEPPPARHPLPGKKLILEAYHSETAAAAQPAAPVQYLPKKMRATEILGGKLAARHSPAPPPLAGPAAAAGRPDDAFLEDPKNVTNRSKSTAAALAREEQEAASPTRSATEAARSPDACCGLDGYNVRTGVICEKKHRERVISICNIDKNDLDYFLNEGNSQENEEELQHYFHAHKQREEPYHEAAKDFLGTTQDPLDDHSQGKNEKISQLRELLAKNLKNQNGSSFQNSSNVVQPTTLEEAYERAPPAVHLEGNFKPASSPLPESLNGPTVPNAFLKAKHNILAQNDTALAYNNADNMVATKSLIASGNGHLFNGNGHGQNVPQSPTTRTQQYDFVPISDGCQSPGNFQSKSPLGFVHRSLSPSKLSKPAMMGRSLQTSPISHSTAASPFVSPRNTPVPRSRLCPRPIPKHNGRKKRNPLTIGLDACPKQFPMPYKGAIGYCQPMSAPPSPNIICSQYKNHMIHNSIANGNGNIPRSFFYGSTFREHANGETAQPLSADPLSSEVSQFFQESVLNVRPEHDTTFRSQSVPLKQGINIAMMYNKTPVGSVPPTPVPNEFCDFEIGDACDISKAGLNSETLDKIYDAIDSSTELNAGNADTLLNANDPITNGCDLLPAPQILPEELNSLMPNEDINGQFNQPFTDDSPQSENVEDFLKRTSAIELDLSELVTDKNKFYMSRSVPSTPVPYKRSMSNLQIDPRRARELFATDNYSATNGISSKSVPSTPQMMEEENVFSYNRDFLINGNTVETCAASQMLGGGTIMDNSEDLEAPLHEMLLDERDNDILEPLSPANDLLSDLDKIEGPYVDL